MELAAEKKYKQTEVGLIPEDWEVKEFEKVMDGFSSGQTPYRAIVDYYKGNIPWITSGELNYNVITDTFEKITPEAVRAANLKMIPKGTFLFAITGLEAAGTRGSCAITGIEATTNQSCMALYPKENILITSYLYHFYVRYGNELAFKYCQGTKQQSYTGAIAKRLPIIVPPSIEEQTAIATVLSDADALISSLEKLIAKKRDIKQGAMQKLLEPKEGWEVKRLGDLGEVDSENLGADTNPSYSFKYISLENVDRGVLTGVTEMTFSSAPSRARRKVERGDILISTVRPNLKSHLFIKDEVTDWICSTGFSVLRCNDNIVNSEYVFHHLFASFINSQIETLISGSNYPSINSKDVKSLELPLPSLNEQTRIATILSDMDAEIDALEMKLEKYRSIKQGMMQNLLTGKIRLV